jgi:hypothetical protein
MLFIILARFNPARIFFNTIFTLNPSTLTLKCGSLSPAFFLTKFSTSYTALIRSRFVFLKVKVAISFLVILVNQLYLRRFGRNLLF